MFTTTTSFGLVSLCHFNVNDADGLLKSEVSVPNLHLFITPDNTKIRLEGETSRTEFAIRDYEALRFSKQFLLFQSNSIAFDDKHKFYPLWFQQWNELDQFLTAYKMIRHDIELSKAGVQRCSFAASSGISDDTAAVPSKRKCRSTNDAASEPLAERAATADVSTPCNGYDRHAGTAQVAERDDIKDDAATTATIDHANCGGDVSEFERRTEAASAEQYFQFYAYLSQQQNMLQDYVRTTTYQRAIFDNMDDFRNKLVMDVGAGSGILSFFASQAGASRVYAVEASSIAVHCQELVRTNNFFDRIKVLNGKVEEICLPEQVDMIVSEPMGYMLVNERMLESFISARRFLKPGGRMFPSQGDLYFALFSDEQLYLEQMNRTAFWFQENFYGVNLSALKSQALAESFRQPVVDTWPTGVLVSKAVKWSIDFEKDPVEKLHRIEVPFSLEVLRTCNVHGIATWFDVSFIGKTCRVWLSTAPSEPLTHWYQVRCLFQAPILAHAGQVIHGSIFMIANEKQSYDIELSATSGDIKVSNNLDLKSPYFRAATATTQYILPGTAAECPSTSFTQELSGEALLERLKELAKNKIEAQLAEQHTIAMMNARGMEDTPVNNLDANDAAGASNDETPKDSRAMNAFLANIPVPQ